MDYKRFFNIDSRILSLSEKAEQMCRDEFEKIEQIRRYNQVKVLNAFTSCSVSSSHLVSSTGYGYDDRGREVLDEVFAKIAGAEDAVVRHNFVSGTHTIKTALFALLRPGDTMLSLTGTVYDTLLPIIGVNGKKGDGSLYDFGIKYKEVALKENGLFDLDGIKSACRENIKVAYIQRSRGYSLRPSYTSEETKQMIDAVREVNHDAIIVVDNCYCEFVDEKEPTEYGADIMIGSLIKNAGGGIVRTGGYIAGRKKYVQLCADALCYIGTGKEIGCTLDMNRELYLGLFMAPQTVANAVKTAVFAAAFYSLLGFKSTPAYKDKRADIVECLLLNSKEDLCCFCKGIQSGSPVDSFVVPEPSDMPGYDSEVIMAAGTFTLGSSIELSADAPLREPYAVWLQGSLSFDSSLIALMLAAQKMLDENRISL